MTITRIYGLVCGLAFVLSACATPPSPVMTPPDVRPLPPATVKSGEPPEPHASPAAIDPSPTYGTVPGWDTVDPRPGLSALQRSCTQMEARADNDFLSDAAPWAGRVGEWRAPCREMARHGGDAATARVLIEGIFVPVEVVDPAGNPRFTGYFEPVIQARRRPSDPFTAPIPGPPGDLVVDGDRRLQRLRGGRTRPYPARADIRVDRGSALGYAHPADLFFMQIQGSGRLVFEDGTIIRAAYHGHNGRPFRSTANWLIDRGEIALGEASMTGIRTWMDQASPSRLREAINANPRFVFFEAQSIQDPRLGPAGAHAVPLTAFGSMAVDPNFHALGVPYVVETDAPGLGGTWRGMVVSQDTGGAINGPVRGDLFFGTGDQAGERAGTLNAPGRLWALLPPAVAVRLKTPGDPDIPAASF